MPELRRDPLTGCWTILSSEYPAPLDGASAEDGRRGGKDPLFLRPASSCPLCPGHEAHTPSEVYAHRPPDGAAAGRNAPGWSLRVVPHKFPALRIEGDMDRRGVGLFDRMNGVGAHEVIVESPDHARQLRDLGEPEIEQVLWAGRQRIIDLKRDTRFRYIALHKAHGRRAGAMLGHSHTQLLALPVVPPAIAGQVEVMRRHFEDKDRCLLCDMAHQEIEDRSRVVFENNAFVVFCPYAARSPFETWIVPRHHRPIYEDTPPHEYAALAGALRVTLRKLFLALDDPCYSFTLHNAPFLEKTPAFFHWHLRIVPALSAGLSELGPGMFINPTPPEEAARYLRELVT